MTASRETGSARAGLPARRTVSVAACPEKRAWNSLATLLLPEDSWLEERQPALQTAAVQTAALSAEHLVPVAQQELASHREPVSVRPVSKLPVKPEPRTHPDSERNVRSSPVPQNCGWTPLWPTYWLEQPPWPELASVRNVATHRHRRTMPGKKTEQPTGPTGD